MKIYAKLLVIALMIAMIFAVGSVSAVENGTADASDLTLVPHEQVVSVPDSTVQEVETINTETSVDDTNVEKISSSSDEIINVTDSNVKGSLKMSKKGGPVLGASNNNNVLGANKTITPNGTTFYNISQAISKAQDGDTIDLGGKTYNGTNPGNLGTNKAITIINGVLNPSSTVSAGFGINNCKLVNVTFQNFYYTATGWPINFKNSTFTDVNFINMSFPMAFGTANYTKFEGCKFINLTSRYPYNPDYFEYGAMLVLYNSEVNNSLFNNCTTTRHSGAICVAGRSGNTVNITNSDFINCKAGIGGAIYVHGTNTNSNRHSNIINCNFINCEATEWGGAIGSSQDYLNVENCNFINNSAKQGAAFMVGGIRHGLDGNNTQGHYNTMKNCYFYNNTGSEEGGAVHITGHYNSAIDCTFDDNFAINGKGAAIYVEGNHASIDGSNFTNHQSDMGTVYIEGNYFNCSDSIFDGNVASHGGAGIYVEGKDTYIYNTKFTNNNASRHGGAVHTIGDNARILNSDFTYNNAIPSSTNTDYGLGGAVYIDGANNTISYSRFKHNTARNGSAIYNRGEDLTLVDDTFEDNQAWSYFLFTESKPQEAYWDENLETLINVTLVGGDNLINAIYNDRSIMDIYFHNVTYYMKPNDLYPTGKKTTTINETHPVNGVENSHGGLYLYQDAREDNQVIKVNITHGGNKVYEYEGKTDMYGNVLLSIKKENLSDGQYHPGVYDVTASHPDDTIYTAIDNRTSFRILPHVDVSVTKTSNKDVYFVGENAIFTIRVYGVGTNATNVRVKDILPQSLKFVSASATRGSYDSINNEWYIGFLPHEGSETLTLTVKTTELGTFDNVVNVTCDEKDWNLSNNVDNKTIHVDLYYTKEANVTNTSAGEYLEYYIRIYNVGSTDYTETVRVYDVLPEGIRYADYYKLEGADLVKFIGYPDQQVWDITNITAGTHAKITIKALALKDGIWNNTARVWEYPPVNATVNVTSSADLRIFKEASSEYVNKDDLVNWTIIVKNDGPSKAMGVYVNDVLPNGLDIYGTTIASKGNYNRASGVWTIGDMDVGEIVNLIIPTRVTISAHNITNVAIVNSSTPDPNPTNNEDNDTVYFNPDVTIEKTVSTRKTYHGDTISWNITVTNKGPNDAFNVYVIDKLPAGLIFVNSTRVNYNPVSGRWNIGTLKDGESITLIINTEVTIYAGSISNNATVYSSNDRDLGNNYADDYTQVITEADVEIVKLVSNQTSHRGDEIVWTIVVTNHGPNTAEDVYVIDFLPTADLIQTREPERSKGHVSHLGQRGLWTIGSLVNGENATLKLFTKVLSTNKTIINAVNVTTSTYERNLSNNWAENLTYVPPEADVAVIKHVDNFTPNKGDTVTWTISVVNNGPNVAENVIVNDVLPAGKLEYVSNTQPTKGEYYHNRNIWEVHDLAPGVRHSLTITTKVIDTGKITNEANVTTTTYETDLTNNYDNETIDVPAIADLEITKLVSNKTSKYGDLINWTVTVHNKGPNNARNVVVNDKLPAGLVYITHNGPGLYDPTQGIWQIGDLGIDASVTLTITTRVNITNTTITNIAVVTSDTPDNDTSNNEANNTTDVDPMADLAIYKVVSNTNPQKGNIVTWIINVVNYGPDTAINAVATDILPANLTYISHNGNGTYDPTTGEWTIGNVENGGVRVLYINTTVDASKAVITNIVNVTSQTPDPDLTNNEDNATIDVGHQTDLEVIKTVSNATPKKGDKVVWNITVLNHGPDDAIDTRVYDILPKGLVWISDDSNGAYNPSTGIWTIGTLPVNNNVTLLITTLVNVSGQNITNVAEVTTDTNDTNESNNKDNDTIEVPKDASADLEVIKVVSNKNPRFGDIITWTVTVTNRGPNTAVDAYVIDKLPKGLIYQNDDSNGKYDPDSGYWIIGNLTNGAKDVLNIQTLVNITNATITNVAVVNSTTPDNNTENNKANNTTDVDPEVDLEIIKLVSNKNPKFGDEITWTIVVTNKGPDTALEVYVRDKLPAGLILTEYSKTKGIFDENDMAWYIKSLAKGESQTLTLTTFVDVTNKTLVNIVNVTNDVYDPNKTNNEANNSTDVLPEADLQVIKTAMNSTCSNGDIVYWNITIINHGPDAAVNVSILDVAQKGLILIKTDGTPVGSQMISGSLGITLPSGGQISFIIKTLVNATNATLMNMIAVSSETHDPNPKNNLDNDTTKVRPEANLVVVKEVSKQTVKTGETVTWTVTVTNDGPDTAVNTRVTDELPAGLIYTGHKADVGNYDPDTGVWIVGDLAKGESKKLVISTIANIANKTIVNVANVTSDTPGNRTNGTNKTTTIGDIADLEVVKLVSNKNPKFGDEITWTIIVTNHGPDKAIAVNVTDKLPVGLRYNGHSGPGLFDSSNGIWIIGDMEKGDSVSLSIRTIVEISNGTIENIAVVNSSTPDNNTDNNIGNNTTKVNDDADLEIIKLVSNKNPKFGETITWTITVTNKGPSDAKNVRVTDKLPAGLIFNGANGNYNKDTGLWIVGDLANGKSASLVITTIVNITNTTILNVANVTSDTPDSNKTNNEANNTTDVGPKADLVIGKEVSKKSVKTGEVITWTITVTNNGPDTAVNTRVTDKLPAGLIYITSSGNYDPVTGLWIVGDLANGESKKLVIYTQVNITNATIVNVANTTSDTPGITPPPVNNSTKVDPKADLVISKEVSKKSVKTGEVITWTITVTNKGPNAAVNTRVTDKLPAGLVYLTHAGDGNYDFVSGFWIVGDLANGASAKLVITTQVNITNTTIVNVANVTTDTPGITPPPVNNSTKVDPKADLVIGKEVSKKSVKTGEVITWTITVTNKGPDAAVNTRVTDKLPAGLIYKESNGNYDPVTGLWIVGDLANGASAKLVITTQVNITNATIVNVANVTSDTPGITPPPVNNSTEVDPKADLVIGKEVSKKSVKTGEVITWTITVTNNGPDVAVNTRVTDKLPAGLIYLTHSGEGNYDPVTGLWIVGDLANGESASLVITTQVNITNATIVNVANVTSDTPGITPPPVNNSTEVDPKADLVIVKEVSKQSVETGEVITWTITVTNKGPDAAVNTRVTDKLPAGLIFITSDGSYDPVTGLWTVGDLANGQSASLVITTQVNITNATIRNVANATSDTPGNDTPGNNTTEVDPKADLIVVKEVSKQSVKTGETVIWTITVTNNGPDAAVNTRVTDKLPDGLVYVTHEGEGNYDHVSGVWIVGDLANGESKQLVISTIANIANKTIVNVANVTSDTPGNRTPGRNNTTVVEENADLEVIKSVIGENPHKGDIITWIITVINHGPSDAKNVIVTDRLPAGLIFDGADGNYNPDTGVWTVGDLTNGESVSLKITTIVDITNAEITNVAVVNSTTPDNNTDNNKDNDTTNVDPEADLKVIKTVSNPKPTVGDVITWTITVINLGPDAAEDVIVEDMLPAGLKLISAKGSKGDYEDGIWTVGTLNDKEAATLVLTTRVTASSGIIKNVATAIGSTYDPNKSNNRDDDVTKPKAKPMADLEISKVANVEKVKVGDKIIWTITVTNYGPDVAKNVRVKDAIAGDVEYISSRATKGSFDPLYGLWTIGDMEVGEEVVLTIVAKALSAGTVINTAEVVSDTPDPDMSNNKDKAIVVVKDKPTPDNPSKTPKTPRTPATMHATGNPIVMVLLALFALVGVTLRRKN